MMRGWLVAFVLSCGLVVPGLRSPVDAADDLEVTLGLSSASAGTIQPAAISGAPGTPGLPLIMSASAPFSAAVATGLEHSMVLLGDWDGNEDLTADHGGKVAELPDPGNGFVTRVAISEHSMANGFAQDIFYFGDSVGNVYVVATTDVTGFTSPNVFTINLPTVLNAFGTLNSDSHVAVTGLAVNPVADLTSFPNVNGSFNEFAGQTGEILYVSFLDTGGGVRLASGNQVVHSGLLAFPVADVVSAPADPPSPISPAGYPVTVGASFGVLFSTFANVGGVAVDDEGDVYFHQADLLGLTGGNIVKLTSVDKPGSGGFQDRSLATNGFLTVNTLNPTDGVYGTAGGPATQSTRVTNYSGTSPLFGNVTALAVGPNDAIYAAVARSFSPADDAATRATEGLFAAPAELGATPSMIISFSDRSGAVDTCSAANALSQGIMPIGDGFADAARAGLGLQAGVNNYRVFVLGDGPDLRGPGSLYGTTADTPRIAGFQVDYSLFSGLAVDEQSTVYAVSGGTPFGVGRDPSPEFGEILSFPDRLPRDRRADVIDLRGDVPPSPPASGGNTGDGVSDRFDHIFLQAPLDSLTLAPSGLAGLSRGFLRYLNRTAPIATVTNLPAQVQADDSTNGPLAFDQFDPSHQVAGGDDQFTPFHGDDSDGAGAPAIAGALNGGFELSFGAISGVCTTPWNAFFLNSNGNITFGAGDTDNTPTVAEMVSSFARIAPAWADHLPSARLLGFNQTFPVQALGFAGVNAFTVRWIDVPQFGLDGCGSSNTFSITLYDDGTGVDENSNQAFNAGNPAGNNVSAFDGQEGPTDLRWLPDGNGGVVPASPRPDGSGQFRFDYGRMDLMGSAPNPVIAGYSIGFQGVPASFCESDPGAASRHFDGAGLSSGLIGDDTKAFLFAMFDGGSEGQGGTAGVPNFDLRAEGNDPALTTAATQPRPNRDMVGFAGIGCGGAPSTTCSCVIVADPAALPAGTAGAAYAATLVGHGGAAPYAFGVTSGALPPGLTLDAAGNLTGTPTTPGAFAFAVRVNEATGCGATQSYVVNVTGAAPPPPPAGCARAASFDSIDCRLGEMTGMVGASTDLGSLQKKLGKLLTKARAKSQKASSKGKKGKRLLGSAMKTLKAFDKLLNSKKGKKIPAATHDALIAGADAIQADMAALRGTL
jgi:hypothetical protein